MSEESLKFKHNCVNNSLREHNADAFLFIGKVNRFWLTGLSTQDGYVLVTKDCIYLFVDKRDFEYCKGNLSSSIKLVEYTGYNSIRDLCNELKLNKICFDADQMSVNDYIKLNENTKLSNFIPINSQELRKIKCKEEIDILQKSANIAVEAITDCRKWLKPGVTEIEASNHIRDFMLNLGATNVSFDLIVAFGINTANPHHQPGQTVLEKEMLVTLDIGCIYQGYCSDITRSFYVGKDPSYRIRDLYDTVLSAQQMGLDNIMAKNTGKYIDSVVRKYIDDHRQYHNCFSHGLGHGVGLEIHELPANRSTYTQPLGVDSVVTVEPGIYIDGFAGVRIEDTIVVKENGIINLTINASKEFFQ